MSDSLIPSCGVPLKSRQVRINHTINWFSVRLGVRLLYRWRSGVCRLGAYRMAVKAYLVDQALRGICFGDTMNRLKSHPFEVECSGMILPLFFPVLAIKDDAIAECGHELGMGDPNIASQL
jgi:hypothetical protein